MTDEILEKCAFDPAEQSEPTCACGYELDTEFTPSGTPWESEEWDGTQFCWNCRFYWGPSDSKPKLEAFGSNRT